MDLHTWLAKTVMSWSDGAMLKSYWRNKMKEMAVMLVFQINNNYKLHLFHVAFVSIYEKRIVDKVFFILQHLTTLTSQRTGHDILQDAKYSVTYIKDYKSFWRNLCCSPSVLFPNYFLNRFLCKVDNKTENETLLLYIFREVHGEQLTKCSRRVRHF